MSTTHLSTHRITLTPSEFDYMQRMLDHGYLLAQAILALRPDLSLQTLNLSDIMVTVQDQVQSLSQPR